MNVPEPISNAVGWILVLGLAFTAADTTATLIDGQLQVEPKPLPQVAVNEPAASVPAQAAPSGLVQLLATTTPEDAPPPATTGPGNNRPGTTAAPTQAASNMTLRGTMAGVGGSGLAMIDVNGQTQVVSVGQTVGGLTLTRVETNSVRLEANGQIQLLEMDVGLPTQGPAPRPVANTQTAVVPDNTQQQEEDPGDTAPILSQRELRAILDNPQKYAGQGFRMKPVVENGEVIGMQVAIPNASHPMARLGVQNGDVVKSLNGKPINGAEALTEIYRTLRNSSTLRFEVGRGGNDQTIEVNLSE